MPGRKKGLTRAPAHPPSDPSSAAGEAARGDSRCGCEEPFSGKARTGLGGKAWALTCMNFMATSRNPFCSNRLIISPTSPRWTPSGLMAMKVRSPFPAMALRAGARRERTRGLKVGDGHGGTALPRGTATECPPGPAEPRPAPPNPAGPLRLHPPMPLERGARRGPDSPIRSCRRRYSPHCYRRRKRRRRRRGRRKSPAPRRGGAAGPAALRGRDRQRQAEPGRAGMKWD